MGLPTAFLSNSSPEMLASAVASAGLTELLSQVLSVAGIRQIKTAPQCYGRVLKAFAVKAEEVLFVSANAQDPLGATWFGVTTLWLSLQNLPPRGHWLRAQLHRGRPDRGAGGFVAHACGLTLLSVTRVGATQGRCRTKLAPCPCRLSTRIVPPRV